jgi:hypothetical protein
MNPDVAAARAISSYHATIRGLNVLLAGRDATIARLKAERDRYRNECAEMRYQRECMPKPAAYAPRHAFPVARDTREDTPAGRAEIRRELDAGKPFPVMPYRDFAGEADDS